MRCLYSRLATRIPFTLFIASNAQSKKLAVVSDNADPSAGFAPFVKASASY